MQEEKYACHISNFNENQVNELQKLQNCFNSYALYKELDLWNCRLSIANNPDMMTSEVSEKKIQNIVYGMLFLWKQVKLCMCLYKTHLEQLVGWSREAVGPPGDIGHPLRHFGLAQ